MINDLRHGLRVLMKPGFTIIAVISIAIGVGANAAMFSVADGLVFRPLPVPRSSEVVSILGQARDTGFGNRSPLVSRLPGPARPFQDVRQHRRLYLRDHKLHESGERAGAAEGRDGGQRQLLPGDGSASASRSCVACRRKRGTRTQSRRRPRLRRVAPAIRSRPLDREQAHHPRRCGVHRGRRGAGPLHRHRPRREAVVLHPDCHVPCRFRPAYSRTC